MATTALPKSRNHRIQNSRDPRLKRRYRFGNQDENYENMAYKKQKVQQYSQIKQRYAKYLQPLNQLYQKLDKQPNSETLLDIWLLETSEGSDKLHNASSNLEVKELLMLEYARQARKKLESRSHILLENVHTNLDSTSVTASENSALNIFPPANPPDRHIQSILKPSTPYKQSSSSSVTQKISSVCSIGASRTSVTRRENSKVIPEDAVQLNLPTKSAGLPNKESMDKLTDRKLLTFAFSQQLYNEGLKVYVERKEKQREAIKNFFSRVNQATDMEDRKNLFLALHSELKRAKMICKPLIDAMQLHNINLLTLCQTLNNLLCKLPHATDEKLKLSTEAADLAAFFISIIIVDEQPLTSLLNIAEQRNFINELVKSLGIIVQKPGSGEAIKQLYHRLKASLIHAPLQANSNPVEAQCDGVASPKLQLPLLNSLAVSPSSVVPRKINSSSSSNITASIIKKHVYTGDWQQNPLN